MDNQIKCELPDNSVSIVIISNKKKFGYYILIDDIKESDYKRIIADLKFKLKEIKEK